MSLLLKNNIDDTKYKCYSITTMRPENREVRKGLFHFYLDLIYLKHYVHHFIFHLGWKYEVFTLKFVELSHGKK